MNGLYTGVAYRFDAGTVLFCNPMADRYCEEDEPYHYLLVSGSVHSEIVNKIFLCCRDVGVSFPGNRVTVMDFATGEIKNLNASQVVDALGFHNFCTNLWSILKMKGIDKMIPNVFTSNEYGTYAQCQESDLERSMITMNSIIELAKFYYQNERDLHEANGAKGFSPVSSVLNTMIENTKKFNILWERLVRDLEMVASMPRFVCQSPSSRLIAKYVESGQSDAAVTEYNPFSKGQYQGTCQLTIPGGDNKKGE